MASPPSVRNKSSDALEPDQVHDAIIECLAKGMTPPQIAKHMYPEADQKAERKRMRTRLWRMIREDPAFQAKVAQRAKAQMVTDLLPATEALGKRAKRGRPDAIKLLMEASGFHNPRVKHEHSGDIKITMDIPRPARVETEDDVIDVDPVEESDA